MVWPILISPALMPGAAVCADAPEQVITATAADHRMRLIINPPQRFFADCWSSIYHDVARALNARHRSLIERRHASTVLIRTPRTRGLFFESSSGSRSMLGA